MRARASWRRRWPSRDWLLSRSRRRQRFGDDEDDDDDDDDDDGDSDSDVDDDDDDIRIMMHDVMNEKTITSSLEFPVTTCNHPVLVVSDTLVF